MKKARASISPLSLMVSIKRNKSLIYSLTRREIVSRYQGSMMGILWSFFYPILMLGIYTFVFSIVFKAKWSVDLNSKPAFALAMFVGLMFYNFFTECITRSPGLIFSNVNYVKKVLFPLEILPVVTVCCAVFHMVISMAVWIVFYLVTFKTLQPTMVLLPLLVLPAVLFTLGVSWLFTSLGVYFRDVSQIVGILATVLMFLTPIFYPISAIPEEYQIFIQANPLSIIIEQARDVMMLGRGLDWFLWGGSLAVSAMVAWLGFAWFQKTCKGFADVI